ncbi:hypothetical protein A8E86_27735 [Burkholderia cenocepacia]|nr:hypothetical protein A8E82_25995 [Burkholderia cenocepacia]ONV95500.1 hypothetical protein A8E86_27735 [Burkholderia cenocepacia]
MRSATLDDFSRHQPVVIGSLCFLGHANDCRKIKIILHSRSILAVNRRITCIIDIVPDFMTQHSDKDSRVELIIGLIAILPELNGLYFGIPDHTIPVRTDLNRANLVFQNIAIVFQQLIHKRWTPIDQIEFILSYLDVDKHRFFAGNN